MLQETLVAGHDYSEQLECRAVSLDTQHDTACIDETRISLRDTRHAHIEPGHATFVTQQAGQFTRGCDRRGYRATERFRGARSCAPHTRSPV
jgi:hypothetical protein